MLGAEEALGPSAQRVTLRWREPLDAARVVAAWVRQVTARGPLHARLVPEDERRRRFAWEPVPPEELTGMLASEQRALADVVDDAAVDEAARAAHALPFRLRRLDEATLVALVDPKLADSVGAAAWLEDLLGFYGNDGTPELAPALQTVRRVPGHRRLHEHLARPMHVTGWVGRQVARKVVPRGRALDLGEDGAAPAEEAVAPALGTWRHVFDREETRRVLRGPRTHGRSLTVRLLVTVAALMFEADDTRRSARIALGADLATWLPEIRRGAPGNTACCVEVTFRRGRPLLPQAQRACKALGRGTHCRMRRRRLAFLRHEGRYVQRTARLARAGRLRDAPVTHASLRLANLGRRPELRRVEHGAEWLSVAVPAPTPSLTAVQSAGRLALELCFPLDRYDAARIRGFADRLPALLHGGGAEAD